MIKGSWRYLEHDWIATAGSYVFAPKGRLRLFVKHGQGPAALVGDLGRLLDGA